MTQGSLYDIGIKSVEEMNFGVGRGYLLFYFIPLLNYFRYVRGKGSTFLPFREFFFVRVRSSQTGIIWCQKFSMESSQTTRSWSYDYL